MIKKLKPGDITDNQKLQYIFKCSARGGMRRSHRTNSLVLISDYTNALYEDRWINDVFHYTGMGSLGDQSLTFYQNKTLAESPINGVDLYVFEVFEPRQYVFIGQVELFRKPYLESQPGETGEVRKVWVFPLKLKNKYPDENEYL